MPDKSTFMAMREDEREARRRIIIDAALKLIGERRFNEIGMRDIAENAGVSAASIYRYFPSRDDLLAEALIHNISEIIRQNQKRLTEENITLETFAHAVVDHFMDNEATFQIASYLMVKGEMSPQALGEFNRVQGDLLRMFDSTLQKFGVIARVRLFSQAYFASLAGVVMAYRNYPGRDKGEIRSHMHRLARIVAEVFRHGLPAATQTPDL